MDALFFRTAFFFAALTLAAFEDMRTLRVSSFRLLAASALMFLTDFPYARFPIDRAIGWLFGFFSVLAARGITRGKIGLGDAWALAFIGAFGGPRLVCAASAESAIFFLPASPRVKYPLVPAFLLATAHAYAFFGH